MSYVYLSVKQILFKLYLSVPVHILDNKYLIVLN